MIATSYDWDSSFRALRHRDFRLYAAGQLVSLIGTWMQTVAQSWLVYRLTKSEAMLGLTLFSTHLPLLLLAPFGGWTADRISRKRIVMVTQTLAALQALVLAWMTWRGSVTTNHVLLLSFLLGIVNAFDLPGRQTLFVQMVGKDDLISAISLNSATFNVTRVIGPSLGGLLVAVAGEAVCFFINALSFVAMILCVARMKLGANPLGSKPAGGILEGFRYAWTNREIVLVLAMSGLVNIAYAPVLALGPFFADDIFHQGSAGLGVLYAAMGIGAVTGVVRLAGHRGIARLPIVIEWSALGMGAALALFAWSPAFGLSMLLMPLIGFNLVRQNAGGNSLLQSVVPDEYRGRIMAIYSMVVTGLVPIGTLAAGLLSEIVGPRWVMFGAGLFSLIGGLAFRLVLPRFRDWVARQEESACAA